MALFVHYRVGLLFERVGQAVNLAIGPESLFSIGFLITINLPFKPECVTVSQRDGMSEIILNTITLSTVTKLM